jgi:hypothetical protein
VGVRFPYPRLPFPQSLGKTEKPALVRRAFLFELCTYCPLYVAAVYCKKPPHFLAILWKTRNLGVFSVGE